MFPRPGHAPSSAQGAAALDALAARFALLAQDLNRAGQGEPAAPAQATLSPRPTWVACGQTDYLLHSPSPRPALEHLAVNGDRRIVQFFRTGGELLSLLDEPAGRTLLSNDRWLPWVLLPLGENRQAVGLLLATAPGDWPWFLWARPGAEPTVDLGECRSAVEHTGAKLPVVLEQVGQTVIRNLAARYERRPTPGEVLRQATLGGRPLRVLAIAGEASSYQKFCARDIIDGLSRLNVDARVHLMQNGPALNVEVLRAVEAFDPDVLFCNGRGRCHLPGIPTNLCVLAWEQDYCLVNSAPFAQQFGPRDRVMVMIADWLPDAHARSLPAARTAYVNIGANRALYHPPDAEPPLDYDVLFVGNYHPFEAYRQIIFFDRIDASVQRVLLAARDRLRDWVLAPDGDKPRAHVLPDCGALLRQVCVDLGFAPKLSAESWRELVRYFRYRIAHLLLRELYVAAVAALPGVRLGLFGYGWDRLPAVAHLAQPTVENGPPLREAIWRSAINLHLHTWTVHHPRLYDTAAAGGFLLVGRVDEATPLDRVFDTSNEVASFASIGELSLRITHFLGHPGERRAMARRAAERAAREHDSVDRMRQALGLLRTDDEQTLRQPGPLGRAAAVA